MALFAGLPRAYGIYRIPSNAPAGAKKKGTAKTVQQPVTKELWEQHLAGDIQLGIVPIRDNATCVFGAIDVDDYKTDHKALDKKIRDKNLPLVMCRSKSGGAHLYSFYQEASACVAVRELNAGWAATLGYANVEIFPKQDELLSIEDTGNWINMPYCGGKDSDRYAIHQGEKLSASEFLALAEKLKVAGSIFDSTDEFPELLVDAPPCLITLGSQGYPEGTRNSGLFNLGIYCRKRWGDDWEAKLDEMNTNFLSPPLESSEVKQLVNHLSKKEYNYKCKDAPINAVCQRAICLKRKYGVESIEAQRMFGPQLSNVSRLETSPAMYFADFEGRRIKFKAEQLVSQASFRHLLADQANRILFPMQPMKWISWVEAVMKQAVIVEAPPETSQGQVIVDCLEEYCIDKWPAKSWDEVIEGGAFEHEGRMYFRPHKFVQSVNKEHHLRLTSAECYQELLKAGCQNGSRKIRRKTYPLWSVPAFERPQEKTDEL